MRRLVSLIAVVGMLVLPLGDADARRKRKPLTKKKPPAEETKPAEEATPPPDAPDAGAPGGEAVRSDQPAAPAARTPIT